MADVALRNVVKKYDDVVAVSSINLDIPNQEFVVLVGPSGCGKSTTLRMIAGLEEITGGEIAIGGTVVNDLPPKDRDIAMVFQNYALYPHMTVAENMSFGLKLRKFPKAEIKARVDHAAGILDITELLARRPKQLSGGQRQRVAMGRAIVRNPKVFLFDEPLSNLDAKLRVQMRTEIKRVHQKVKTTTVYVTHDQVEAMTLADRVVVMNGGKIEQIGTPQRSLSSSEDALCRRLHRLAGDEFHSRQAREQRQRPQDQAVGQARLQRAARAAPRAIAATPARNCCSACAPSTSPRRAAAKTASARSFRSRSTWSSRWAWKPWCSSRSTAPRSAAASSRPPPRARARSCSCAPTSTTCT